MLVWLGAIVAQGERIYNLIVCTLRHLGNHVFIVYALGEHLDAGEDDAAPQTDA